MELEMKQWIFHIHLMYYFYLIFQHKPVHPSYPLRPLHPRLKVQQQHFKRCMTKNK